MESPIKPALRAVTVLELTDPTAVPESGIE
jgi:hypothetical protein